MKFVAQWRLVQLSVLVASVAARSCDPSQEICENLGVLRTINEPLTKASRSLPDECPLICAETESTCFGIQKRYDNPRIELEEYILYGRVELDIKGAPGQGVILSFYLQSDDLDEIDIAEIFGANHLTYQSNFFYKGDITTFGEVAFHETTTLPINTWHRYGIVWTRNSIEWLLDGKVLRRASHKNIPDTPMKTIISLWVGGDESNNSGTVLWAGGLTDFAKAPFRMYVRNLTIENYTPATRYIYGKNTPLTIETLEDSDELDSEQDHSFVRSSME